jgi:peptide/nickel transport system substrate-binding protein
VFSNGKGFAGLAAPLWYWPMSNSSYWAPLNGLYYATGGNDGVPHEGEQARLLELYELATAEFNEDVQNRYVRESMEIHAENLFQIGVVGYPPWPVVQSNRMRNVPDEYVLGGFNPYLIHPQTFYLEQ